MVCYWNYINDLQISNFFSKQITMEIYQGSRVKEKNENASSIDLNWDPRWPFLKMPTFRVQYGSSVHFQKMNGNENFQFLWGCSKKQEIEMFSKNKIFSLKKGNTYVFLTQFQIFTRNLSIFKSCILSLCAQH